MRILYASETYPPTINGAAIFTARLAEEMARRGHEVSVITTSTDIQNHAQKVSGVTVYRVRSLSTVLKPSQRFSVAGRGSIKEIVRSARPEVVHIHNHFFIGSSALEAGKNAGAKIVGTNHMGPGDISAFLPDFIKSTADRMIWEQFARVYCQCDYLTAPSRFAFSLFEQHGVKKEGEVVSNGVDLGQFRPERSGEEDSLRKEHSLPEKPIVLYAGRLDPGKEIEVWIRSIPRALSEAEAHFALLGPGNKKSALGLARSLGVEKNLSFIEPAPYLKMPAFYRLAKLFAISSTIETQGMVVLEAMASGLPVVAACCGALPELVNDGENGFLFETGNSQVMGERVAKLIKDPGLSKSMGEKSRQLAQGHSIQGTFDAFERIYNKLAGPAHSR